MSEVHAVFYNHEGLIVSACSCDERAVKRNQPLGTELLITKTPIDLFSMYVHNGEILVRPEMGVKIPSGRMLRVGESVVIADIPEGTIVTCPDGSEVVDDGILEWPTHSSGTYIFTLTNAPFVEQQIIVTVD